jgi:hypothetical protein
MKRQATIALGTSKENSAKAVVELDHLWSDKNCTTLNRAVLAVIERIELSDEARIELVNKIKPMALFDMEENLRYCVSSSKKTFTLVVSDALVKVMFNFR